MQLPRLMQMADGSPVVDWPSRRAEILHLLERHLFGIAPPVLAPGTGNVVKQETRLCAGHAVMEEILITVQTEKTPFTFPMKLFLPVSNGPHPLFLFINFTFDTYDKYFPLEEITDAGYAIALLDYKRITSDDSDMTNGLAGCFTRPQDGAGYGKIALWAWAMSRTLDYLLTRDEIDADHIAAIGHSRLGKTALWCAAQDERIRFCFSNDSGCAGAALEHTRHPGGETAAVITTAFPYWFCENYHAHAQNTGAMPFDQHFLLGAIAPRYAAVGSAHLDAWADPYSEQLCCLHASPAWEFHHLPGYIGPKDAASTGDCFHDGCIGYHLRDGIHFLSRRDWQQYMHFMHTHK